MLIRIISGGQSGVDINALTTARTLGLTTGGWMPKGFKTEYGNRPVYKELFGVQEHSSGRYEDRTELNIQEADATLLLGDLMSPGSILCRRLCKKYNKLLYTAPLDNIPEANYIKQWLVDNNVAVLNVAGNRGSKLSADQQRNCIATLYDVFKTDLADKMLEDFIKAMDNMTPQQFMTMWNGIKASR